MRELHDAVVAALSELSPLSREAVIGFYLEGYSYAELAALLGVPVGTLKGRLVLGRRQLRGRLHPWAPEPPVVSTKEQRMQQPDLIPMVIDSVRFSMNTQHRSVVLHDPQTQRYLSIFIGEAEADAIAIGLAGQQLPRPMTHDLSLRLLEPLGATVQRVVASRITDQTFFAEIEVVVGKRSYSVAARPSDAFALAVRAGAPVLVARSVLDAAGVTAELPDSAPLELGMPPPPRVTALLIGMREQDQQTIVGAVLGANLGMIGMHLNPITDEVLRVAEQSGPRLAVVDLGDDPATRLALVAVLRAHEAHLPIIVLGGEAAAATQAGATAHLIRPLDIEALGRVVREAVLAAHGAA